MEKSRERIREDEERLALFYTFQNGLTFAETEVKKWITDHRNSGDLCVYKINSYLLTPWCRVLLEKLTGLQLVKKFPTFHGTRKFITTLTSVRHLSLSWASPI